MIEAAGHGPDAHADALRHVRHARQLSQRELARLAGAPPGRIARLEAGQLPASLESVVGLYRLLGFTVGLHHLFPCPAPPEAGTSGPACGRWEDDGAVAFVDRAGRAFPAHAEHRVGEVPDWLGGRYSWGVECESAHWWTRRRTSDRVALPPQPPGVWLPQQRRARQDGAMPDESATTTAISTAIAAYAAGRPELEEATERFVQLVRELLDDAGINYLSVTGRTKSVESFAAKAEQRRDGKLLHPHPLVDITDQIGVRVITFVPDDVTAVAKLLAEELAVIDDRDMGQETARAGRFGYASRHLLVSVDASRTIPAAYASLRRRSASVQIRTVLQHAWAEFEHDIRYKGTVPEEHAHDLDRRFTLAAGLLELADREFSAIRDRLQQALPERPADPDEPGGGGGIDAQDLAKFLAGKYADAGWSRGDHYTWVSGLLLELGITSVEQLAEVIAPVDGADLSARMGYRYPPGAVRRLDDALLATFGERYVELPGNEHRRASLETRLHKLRD
ncbi:ppGpp synthetase/RelA/SpoT-type nucleotidyltransferase [Humibacillus xanthopallidus]|uniref:PpGpp synthetase/RelA/SpoT-type nucleotidyltransferase n=1 Tax=Humibacillus xanthopallidus TaxID=412689 RepID=A0A543PP62_9MICO|nr:helix-turn-helix domain-containing protein [Humibacillus xanthopallidus]TQN45817.1 ppGpp synthetase/RelA/SpoT-type nucleotidyltransferase [Humibacillus xanthopallidus]